MRPSLRRLLVGGWVLRQHVGAFAHDGADQTLVPQDSDGRLVSSTTSRSRAAGPDAEPPALEDAPPGRGEERSCRNTKQARPPWSSRSLSRSGGTGPFIREHNGTYKAPKLAWRAKRNAWAAAAAFGVVVTIVVVAVKVWFNKNGT